MRYICIMPCLHYSHRSGSGGGAVCDSEHVDVELICDGVHIHPSMVQCDVQNDEGSRPYDS